MWAVSAGGTPARGPPSRLRTRELRNLTCVTHLRPASTQFWPTRTHKHRQQHATQAVTRGDSQVDDRALWQTQAQRGGCEFLARYSVLLFAACVAALAHRVCTPAARAHRLFGQLHCRHAGLHKPLRRSPVEGGRPRGCCEATPPPPGVQRPATRCPRQRNAGCDPLGGSASRCGAPAWCCTAVGLCPQP